MHNIESPRTDDDAIEQEILAKGKTAPRVTPDDIKANIVSEYYFTGADGVIGATAPKQTSDSGTHVLATVEYDTTASPELDLLTFCVITLRNGFTVTGKSACASPENFDAEIGRNVARADAVQQIWPLMGYQLKEQLFQAQQPPQLPVESNPSGLPPHQQRVVDEKAALDDRREKLCSFIHGEKFHVLCDESERGRLIDQYDVMTTYSTILSLRIAGFGLAQATV